MADEVQIKDAKEYPYWKILAWRFVRAGIAGGLGTTAGIAIVIKPDFSNFVPLMTLLGTLFASGFIAGLISAVFLWLRDTFGNSDKNSVVDKLPL